MTLVLDASMTLAWLFSDERSDGAERAFDEVSGGGATVPVLWWLEVANALQKAVRRNRCDQPYVDRSLNRLRRMSILTDEETARHAWTTTLTLAREECLTPYDASYLELAVRRKLPLASGDSQLVEAAIRRAVPVMTI